MMKGTVSYVNSNPYNGNVLHSFKLQGDDRYYNCGTHDPSVKKGEVIEFDGKDIGNGKFQVNVNTISVLKEATNEVVEPRRGNFRKQWKPDSSKDDYWKAREERDIVTQSVIQLQSSRNSAIALAELLIKTSAVSLEKTPQTKKKGIIEDLVNELTEKFEQQAINKRTPTTTEEPTPEEIVSIADPGTGDEWE